MLNIIINGHNDSLQIVDGINQLNEAKKNSSQKLHGLF